MNSALEQLDTFFQAVLRPFTFPVLGSERIFVLYLLSALAMAYIAYRRIAPNEPPSWRRFLAYCFPAGVYRHPSAVVDYQYFVVNTIVQVLLILPLTAGVSMLLSAGMQHALSAAGVTPVFGPSPLYASLIYTLLLGVGLDFGLFLAHYLQHKIPALWEFHKVHHSAEVLMPLTVYRMHPLDDLVNFAFSGALAGLVDGVVQSLVQGPFGVLSIFSLNLVLFAFYFFGYNLRHSHIWLDYGRGDHLLVSPAMHQIHHSTDPKHFDKNMGFIFAFWDRLFGTQYIPKERETIEFGLNRAGEHKEYDSVWELYWRPFRKVGRQLRRLKPQTAMWLILGGAVLWVGWAWQQPPSVQLSELTSPEIKTLVERGYTTVIIPTGGVEQNGPHMAVGKHNYVVGYTAAEIAKALGHTLVAPVIPLSPAGDLNPPTEHMRFAGSMTLPEPQFKAVLEAAARSLKQHGFKTICFVGDSGWSQKPQAEVADALSREWAQEGIKVLQVGDYYFQNGQIGYLMAAGYTEAEIGTHAGIRDTSELWAVFPSGIRRYLRAPSTAEQYAVTGVSGAPQYASGELGKSLLHLKIQAAVRQIRPFHRTPPHLEGLPANVPMVIF